MPATVAPAPPPDCLPGIRTVPKNEVPLDVFAWAQGAPVVGHGELWTTRSAIDVPRPTFPAAPRPEPLVPEVPVVHATVRSAEDHRSPARRARDLPLRRRSRGRPRGELSSCRRSTSRGRDAGALTARFDPATISFRILVGNPQRRPLAASTIVGSLHEVSGPASEGSTASSEASTGSPRGLETWSGGSTGEGEFSVDLRPGSTPSRERARCTTAAAASVSPTGRSSSFAAARRP